MSSSPTLPAAPRTNSLGRAKTDCHTCSQYRRTCDRQRPRCGTCLHRGILCGGYALDLTWTTSNSRRSAKVPGGNKPPVLSPSASGEAEPSTGTSLKASSATLNQSRQFKFKIGKPKKPRKKAYQGSPYGTVVKAQEDVQYVSEDVDELYEHHSEILQRDHFDKILTFPIPGAPQTIREAVLQNRVQELPNVAGDPDGDITGVDEEDKQYLTASVPNYQLGYCVPGLSIPHPPLFGSLEDKYRGVLFMCKSRSLRYYALTHRRFR